MGTGIGIVGARVAEIQVAFVDPSEKSLKGAEKMINSWCDKEIAKERMTAKDKEDVIKRVTYADSIQNLSDVDFVVEAASENFELKKKIFQHLAEITPAHAILATNTSSI